MNRRAFLHLAAASTVVAPSLEGFATAKAAAGGIHPPAEAFVASLPHLLDLAWLPGMGIAVVCPGKPVWQHYLGVANASTKTAITAESVFPAASLGKPIFACVVLRLAEQGAIDLDRPLNQYLPENALTGQWGDKVTARHVLTHSTGLPNWRSEDKQKLTPSFELGSRFQYSGEGFFHLQRVVEHITGAGFESIMQERIFKPLSMFSSTYIWLPDAKDRLVAGHNGPNPFYNRDINAMVFEVIQASGKPLSFWTTEQIGDALMKKTGKSTPPPPNEFIPNVAFSLLTTVTDYARFVSALVDPQNATLGLSPAMRTAMQTPVSHVNSALSWGLGIGVEHVDGQSYLWQWGDNGGWKNFILAHPPTRTGIVVFTNGNNGQRVNERILRAATGIEHPAFLWV
ncbi:MAG TPA: serine hydrolase domain-containing protein [Edaphobacter sp.]|nr:serine hydrolase domain-containing protein [Edaphobacter sp.]